MDSIVHRADVPSGWLRSDFSLFRQGITIGWDFGFRSLQELTRVGEIIVTSVYELRSLRRTPEGILFVLRNPPLRMGAFSAIQLFWDSQPISPAMLSILPGGTREPVMASTVSRSSPISLPVGQRSEIRAAIGAVRDGPHHVRIEMRNLAIPPLVWFEFTARLDQ